MEGSAWNLVLIGLVVSVLMSAGGLAAVGALLVRLPSNYFCDSRPRDFWIDSHPVIRWTGLVGKNVLGLLAVILGGILSAPGIPGPGLLMILIGITLITYLLLYLLLWRFEGPLWTWAVVSMLLGLGFSFFSGATEAWLVDGLQATGYDGTLESAFAKGQIAGGIAMLTGTVAGGIVAQATNLEYVPIDKVLA